MDLQEKLSREPKSEQEHSVTLISRKDLSTLKLISRVSRSTPGNMDTCWMELAA